MRAPPFRGPGRRFLVDGRGIGSIVPFESRALRGNALADPTTRYLGVYTPPGLTDGRPLLVLLPGFAGSGWAEAMPENFLGQSLFRLFDRLVRTRRAPPAVIVAPDALTRLGGSQYVNSPATGRYDDFVVREVIPWARRTYGTSGTGILGQSSGGFGALHLAIEHPGEFDAVGSSAGDLVFEYLFLPEFPRVARTLRRFGGVAGFLRHLDEDPTRLGPPTGPNGSALLVLAMSACYSPSRGGGGGFDLPFDAATGELDRPVWKRWLGFDPAERIRSAAVQRALRRPRKLLLTASSSDEWALDVAARIFAERARRHRVPVEYREFEGAHFDKIPRFTWLFSEMSRALVGTAGRR